MKYIVSLKEFIDRTKNDKRSLYNKKRVYKFLSDYKDQIISLYKDGYELYDIVKALNKIIKEDPNIANKYGFKLNKLNSYAIRRHHIKEFLNLQDKKVTDD